MLLVAARRVDGGRRHDKPADDEKQRQSPQSAHPAAGTLKAARVSDKLSRQLPTASVSSGHVLRPLASTACASTGRVSTSRPTMASERPSRSPTSAENRAVRGVVAAASACLNLLDTACLVIVFTLFVVAKLVCIAAGSLFPASSAQEGAQRPARRGEGEAQAVDEGRSDSCLSQVRPASRDATREG